MLRRSDPYVRSIVTHLRGLPQLTSSVYSRLAIRLKALDGCKGPKHPLKGPRHQKYPLSSIRLPGVVVERFDRHPGALHNHNNLMRTGCVLQGNANDLADINDESLERDTIRFVYFPRFRGSDFLRHFVLERVDDASATAFLG